MKTKLCYLACFVMMQFAVKAQMKIGDNPTTINSASLLELEKTDKGFVLPRVSISDVTTSTPLSSGLLTGTVVYNTNGSTTGGSGAGIYLWNGTKWLFLSTGTSVSSTAWLLTGNSGLSSSTNFIGTTDAIDFVARTANTERMRILGANSGSSKVGWIGMGVTIPRSSLDVSGHYSNKNVITIQNTSTSGFSSVDMLDTAGNLVSTFGYGNLGTGTFAGKAYFNGYGNDFLFTRGSSNDLLMKGTNGYVGLNTNAPSERLHVVGNIYLNGAFMPGGSAGTTGYVLTSAGAGVSPTWTSTNNLAWSLTGNSGLNSGTNFIGTTDFVSMRFKTNNIQRMVIDSLGRVGIGTSSPGYTLSVLSQINPLYLAGVQATSTFTSDSILTINAGVVKKTPYSSLTGNFWSTTGNSGTSYATNFLGTTDNISLRFRTNNIEKMIIDSLGSVGIGSSTFSTSREKLLVDYGTTTSTTVATFKGSIDDFFQINLQNKSSGANASTDYVATSDDGTDSTYYVDMGINSSTYAPGVENFGGPHDAYLYASSRNLLIGAASSNSDIIFLLGGGKLRTNAALRLNGADGNVIVGKGESSTTPVGNVIRAPNALASSTNIAGGNLTLQGGSSTGTAAGGNVLINGGITGTGTAGYITASTASLERLRIDASGNVGISNTSPAEKLDVTGNVRFSGALMPNNLAGTSGYLLTSAGVGTAPTWSSPSTIVGSSAWILGGNTLTAQQNFGTLSNHPIPFYTNNTEKMRLSTSGYLGIGTTAPTSLLHVTATGISAPGILGYFATTASGDRSILDVVNSAANGGEINLRAYGNTYAETLFGNAMAGTTALLSQSSALTIGTYSSSNMIFGTNNTEYMRLTGAGLFGIGTTNPLNKLSVLATNPLYLGGVQATSSLSSDSVLTINGGVVKKTSYNSLAVPGNAWLLVGNSGTNPALNFLGTTDAQPLVFKANNNQIAYMDGNLAVGNIAIGITASNSTSDHNIAIGYGANTNNQYVTALGSYAYATGVNSVAIGGGPSGNSTRVTGAQSIALGYNVNVTTDQTIGIGYQAQGTGQFGVAIGYNPTASASQTVSIGYQSLASGQYGIAIGYQPQATTLQSIAIGYQAYARAQYNTAIGYQALATGGTQATALGSSSQALLQNSTAVGYAALATGSDRTTAIGASAQAQAQYNTAVGYNARATGSDKITVIGSDAQATFQNNTVLGYGALASSNSQSTALGASSQSQAQNATAVGYTAKANTNNSTSLGSNAQAITSTYTTAIGSNTTSSGQYATALGAESDATAQYGTALGYNAQATTNSQTTAIGANTSATGSNSTAIGYSATTSQNNAIVIGTSTNNVGIGTSTPNTSTRLDVAGSFKLGSSGSVLSNVIKGTATISVGALTIGGSANYTFTVTGAATNSVVSVSPRSNLPTSVVIGYAYVSSANTVTVNFSVGGTAASAFTVNLDVLVTQ